MHNNKIIKDLLPRHQFVNSDVNIPYKNIGELFDNKLQEAPDKIFLICPGKRKDTFAPQRYET